MIERGTERKNIGLLSLFSVIAPAFLLPLAATVYIDIPKNKRPENLETLELGVFREASYDERGSKIIVPTGATASFSFESIKFLVKDIKARLTKGKPARALIIYGGEIAQPNRSFRNGGYYMESGTVISISTNEWDIIYLGNESLRVAHRNTYKGR